MTGRPIRFARALRARQTSSEDMLWAQLRGRRLEGLKFRRQVPIAGFIADFCCFDLGLTIEIDGAHHADQAAADRARTEIIESNGYLELRFTNDEIKERLDWVVQEILRAADIARSREMRRPFPRWQK
jgi:lysyl-tRNA synthetase class 2